MHILSNPTGIDQGLMPILHHIILSISMYMEMNISRTIFQKFKVRMGLLILLPIVLSCKPESVWKTSLNSDGLSYQVADQKIGFMGIQPGILTEGEIIKPGPGWKVKKKWHMNSMKSGAGNCMAEEGF